LILILLHSNHLNGSIPETIGNLAQLEALDIYLNKLGGAIPPSIGSLVNLRVL